MSVPKNRPLSKPREVWIDWMKVLGMGLIILGHTGAYTLAPDSTNPFNPKQLGVAFFVFVTAYTLATENRRPTVVVFNRFFEVGLFCLLVAIVMSIVTFIRIGDVNESNYLPLFLGANVVFNSFPANPTTWYVGTYFHLLIAWAFLFRHLRVNLWHFLAFGAAELTVRAAIISTNRDYTAYMLISNWTVVFLLGQYIGQKASAVNSNWLTDQTNIKRLAVGALVTLAIFALSWSWVVDHFQISAVNPFGRIPASSVMVSVWLTSASITFLYAMYTLLSSLFTRSLPFTSLIQFLAANTLIVFLVHMPLIYAISPLIYPYVPQGLGRVACNLAIHFGLLAVLSSVIVKMVQPRRLRRRLGMRLFGPTFQG